MFNPSNLDDVSVQATHLEEREGKPQKKVLKIRLSVKIKRRVSKERKMHPLKKKERKQSVNIVTERITVKLIVGSFILKRKQRNSTTKEKKRQPQPLKRIWDLNQVMKQKSQPWGFKERNPLPALVLQARKMKLHMKRE